MCNFTSSPAVSVLVPVYKVEPWLRRCVDSILAQTFSDFELILVDDGSPDRCPEICDEYARRDPRVRVFHQENRGLAGARTTGLENARGKWISIVDSDDWVEPNYLEEMITAATQETQLVRCNMRYWGTDGRRVPPLTNDDFVEKILSGGKMTMCELMVSQKLYLKQVVDGMKVKFAAGLSTGEDNCFNIRYMSQIENANVVNVDLPLYHYVPRPDGLNNHRTEPWSFFPFMRESGVIVKELEQNRKFDRGIFLQNFAGYAVMSFWTSLLHERSFNSAVSLLRQFRKIENSELMFDNVIAPKSAMGGLFSRLFSRRMPATIMAIRHLNELRTRITGKMKQGKR